MDVYLNKINKTNEEFYSKCLKLLIPIMERRLKESSTGQKLCNDPNVLEEYQKLYKLKTENQEGNVSMEKILRQLFPERQITLRKNSSQSFEDTINTLRDREIKTGLGSGRKRRVYVNFIYGIFLETGIPGFKFGRITKKEYENDEVLLTEDGGKHIQLCRGYQLLYAGTMILTRLNDRDVEVVINPNSGRWFELMKDLVNNRMPDRDWLSIFSNVSTISDEQKRSVKYDILNILMIKRVKHLLFESFRYPDINFMVTNCYHTFLLDMYNHMMFDKKCKLDIGIFLKKIKDMETNKRKR